MLLVFRGFVPGVFFQGALIDKTLADGTAARSPPVFAHAPSRKQFTKKFKPQRYPTNKRYPRRGRANEKNKKPINKMMVLSWCGCSGVGSRLLCLRLCFVVFVFGCVSWWSSFCSDVLAGSCLGVGLKFFAVWVRFGFGSLFGSVCLCCFLGPSTFNQTLRAYQLDVGFLFCSCPSVGALCRTPP